jgi:SAM-dependent methyltransferase
MTVTDSGYLFDNASSEAPKRFAGLAGSFDESTIRYLAVIGVDEGWSCWEVGAGNGSIATWLAERVGPQGTVLATDIDTSWIAAPESAHLTVAHHDVVNDPIPTGAYDLVHARLVLVHLPERESVLKSLARSLRPGGWLLVEDFDYVIQDGWEPTNPDDHTYRRVHQALQQLLAQRGADSRYARRLPQLLREAGLRNVSLEGRFVLGRAAHPGSEAMRANFLQTADELVAKALASRDDISNALALLSQADFPVLPIMISAWAQHTT